MTARFYRVIDDANQIAYINSGTVTHLTTATYGELHLFDVDGKPHPYHLRIHVIGGGYLELAYDTSGQRDVTVTKIASLTD